MSSLKARVCRRPHHREKARHSGLILTSDDLAVNELIVGFIWFTLELVESFLECSVHGAVITLARIEVGNDGCLFGHRIARPAAFLVIRPDMALLVREVFRNQARDDMLPAELHSASPREPSSAVRSPL